MLRLEETLVNFIPNGPARYEFDGYSPELIDYNTKKLHEADLVGARNRSNGDREVPKYWLTHFLEKGMWVVPSIRNEDSLKEVLETLEERDKTPTIEMLTHYLLDVVQKVAV